MAEMLMSDDWYDASFEIGESLTRKEARMHPSPEHFMMREAVKHLTKRQQTVWELYNYDRMTQEEIGRLLNISKQAVNQRIGTIEKRIKQWIEKHMETYKALKANEGTNA